MTVKKKSINVFFLTMINIATILSIRNWPTLATYGLASISFLVIAVLIFFLPSAFVSAELATGWPKRGGIFAWVKEAIGHKWGFLAIWLLWVENVVWYPIVLSFVAATFAYAFDPALAHSKWYTFSTIVGGFWLFTYLNLYGMKFSGWISTIGVILGTLLPGLLIIALGLFWYLDGEVSQVHFSWGSLIPQVDHLGDLAFFAGVLLSFCGIEMSAVHVKDVAHPQKDYPRAIFFSTSIIILLTMLGTLAIAIVIPQTEISLVAGSIETIAYILKAYNLEWMISVAAILITIGALGAVSTWAAGPCRGLLAAAEKGDFPPLLQKVNRHDMPVALMVAQGIIVTLLSSVFIFMPSVSSSFWILTVLASQLYLVMYILMFISVLVLRYKEPHTHRAYTIPGGKLGIWIVSGLGLLGSAFAMVIGFFPPSQLDTGNRFFFIGFLLIGLTLFLSAPFLLLALRRPTWLVHKT